MRMLLHPDFHVTAFSRSKVALAKIVWFEGARLRRVFGYLAKKLMESWEGWRKTLGSLSEK